MSPALFWTKLPADHALAAAVYTARANARRDAGDATEAARLDEAAEGTPSAHESAAPHDPPKSRSTQRLQAPRRLPIPKSEGAASLFRVTV
jgi:hypothetical protein